jgi:hypothetical protein
MLNYCKQSEKLKSLKSEKPNRCTRLTTSLLWADCLDKWNSRHLTALSAATAHYRDTFYFLLIRVIFTVTISVQFPLLSSGSTRPWGLLSL